MNRIAVFIFVACIAGKVGATTHVKGALCNPTACMEITKLPEYSKIKFSRKLLEKQFCFVRWENFKYDFELGVESKFFYLKNGYNFKGIRWRCDVADTCLRWMKDAGLCT